MGMRCDVYGVTVKYQGLLTHAVEVAFGEERASDSVVVLSREEVGQVVSVMRREILNGWAAKSTTWARSYGSDEPLSYLNDIKKYATDVNAFRQLCLWLAYVEDVDAAITTLVWK
jgi:hypothetical protein